MVWRKKSGGGADEDNKIPKGHVPMVAGNGDGERVLMPVRLLSDPSIAELLDMAAQQYGYRAARRAAGPLRRVPLPTGRRRRHEQMRDQLGGVTHER
jgi:SAUR family protein